ncbi:hypothetical protein Q5P01_020386 [Channa striata]|uniref:Uncharacterized protein n=1 Tax=Channa striata TaxID=64152 RepID=A0AA88LXM4_CHASR|nr:hypothetical protein Q5P01_020386 [Channa striata]
MISSLQQLHSAARRARNFLSNFQVAFLREAFSVSPRSQEAETSEGLCDWTKENAKRKCWRRCRGSFGTGVMTSLKRPPMERTVGGSIPATDEFYTRHLRIVNGAAVPNRTDNVHATVSTGVPKMGVRARVADWPPRKDIAGAVWHSSNESENSGVPFAGKSHVKLGSIMSPQDSSMLRNIHNTLKNRTQVQANNYSPDTSYLSPGDCRGPANRSTRQRRIRQRSNSDMTISEMEGSGDSGEDWGPSFGSQAMVPSSP